MSLGDLWCFSFFLSEPDVDKKPCPASAVDFDYYCFTLVPLWLSGVDARDLCIALGGLQNITDTDTERALIGCTGAAWQPNVSDTCKLNNVCNDNALGLDCTVMLRCF